MSEHRLIDRKWSTQQLRARGECLCGAKFAVTCHHFHSAAEAHTYASRRVYEQFETHRELMAGDDA